MLVIVSIAGLSQPSEKKDKPNELMMSHYCNYSSLNEHDINHLLQDSKKHDALASFSLYFGYSFFKNKEVPNESVLLNQLIESKNPYGLMIKGFMHIDKNEYEQGIKWLEFAAHFGIFEAIDYLIKIYKGEGVQQLKNIELANYWIKKRALMGNIYRLKTYIHENPYKLNETQLKNWQDAYDIIANNKTLQNSHITLETQWIINFFYENKKNTLQNLKRYHPWYANYKFCYK